MLRLKDDHVREETSDVDWTHALPLRFDRLS